MANSIAAALRRAEGKPEVTDEPRVRPRELDHELRQQLIAPPEGTITGRQIVVSEMAVKAYRQHEEPKWDKSEAKRMLFEQINRSSYSQLCPNWLTRSRVEETLGDGNSIEERGFLIVEDRLVMPIGARLDPRPPRYPLARALLVTCIFRES